MQTSAHRHVALVAFTGLRIGEERMLELGMQLPGLGSRANAIAELPALGLLTLAALVPSDWTCSYHETGNHDHDVLAEQVLAERPELVAISALTASIEKAYTFAAGIRAAGIPVVLGGLHATACPEEALMHCNAVVVGHGEPVWFDVCSPMERPSKTDMIDKFL